MDTTESTNTNIFEINIGKEYRLYNLHTSLVAN